MQEIRHHPCIEKRNRIDEKIAKQGEYSLPILFNEAMPLVESVQHPLLESSERKCQLVEEADEQAGGNEQIGGDEDDVELWNFFLNGI